ncbi:unnamed protein product [Ostreobium quekettii]|uniref:Uncharacterized protein n=1 Tax=Ostreobium quekettii TaxID=121088 RepID=A0A8S1J9U4_9CHLO|nr:unnamed protein product [Ostreobium quekettii]
MVPCGKGRLLHHIIWLLICGLGVDGRKGFIKNGRLQPLVPGQAQGRNILKDDTFLPNAESFVGHVTSDPGQEFGLCTLNESRWHLETNAVCKDKLTCVPILTPVHTPGRQQDLERRGVCVKFQEPVSYVFDSNGSMPIPVAYFPLTDGNTASWPIKSFEAVNASTAVFSDDEIFGRVLHCKEGAVVLPSVSYGRTGQFAINMWVRPMGPRDDIAYQYIYSHTKLGGQPGGLSDSQIHIYLARSGLPAHGVLRTMVKDGNDVGASNFLDSDGVVSNNGLRAALEENPNLFDNKWHMVTVTSNGASEKGFSLYIDGKIAGKMAEEEPNQEAEGGDPVNLSGEIFLCSRTDQSPQRLFNGKLAHLALFDERLSPPDVMRLYATFFSTKAMLQHGSPEGKHFTKDGHPCYFPAILRGGWVDECSLVDDFLQCPFAPGSWQKCDQRNVSNAIEGQRGEARKRDLAVNRYTSDGETCHFPAFYGGRWSSDCLEINGKSRCQVEGSTVWKECSEYEPSAGEEEASLQSPTRMTIRGEPCEFPFLHDGKKMTDCTIIAGHWSCKVDSGEIVPCRVERDPGTDSTTKSSELPISRVTVDGEKCSFPFWFDATSIGDCANMDGVPTCATNEGVLKECAPLRLAISGKPCAFPFERDGINHTECLEIEGESQCMIADGKMEACAPVELQIPPAFSFSVNGDATLLAGRVTVHNNVCSFPFWYGGVLHSTCVPRFEGDADSFCHTGQGNLEQCKPVRRTVDGKDCSFPSIFNGDVLLDCVEQSGDEWCTAADGDFQICAPANQRVPQELLVP